MARRELMAKLFATMPNGGQDRAGRHAWATEILQSSVTTFRLLTDDEIGRLISAADLRGLPDDGPCDEIGCIGHDPGGWCVGESGETWAARTIAS